MSFFSCARSLYYPGLPTEPLQITPRRSISALGFGFITQLYFPAIDNPTECDAEREPSNRQTNDCNEPQHYTSTRVAMPYPFVPIEATPDVSDPPPQTTLAPLATFAKEKQAAPHETMLMLIKRQTFRHLLVISPFPV